MMDVLRDGWMICLIKLLNSWLIDWLQEDAGELEKALTQDERAKLYDAIGYQEDAEEGTLEYPRRFISSYYKNKKKSQKCSMSPGNYFFYDCESLTPFF